MRGHSVLPMGEKCTAFPDYLMKKNNQHQGGKSLIDWNRGPGMIWFNPLTSVCWCEQSFPFRNGASKELRVLSPTKTFLPHCGTLQTVDLDPLVGHDEQTKQIRLLHSVRLYDFHFRNTQAHAYTPAHNTLLTCLLWPRTQVHLISLESFDFSEDLAKKDKLHYSVQGGVWDYSNREWEMFFKTTFK